MISVAEHQNPHFLNSDFLVSHVQHVGSWVLSFILVVETFSWNITDIYVTWYKLNKSLELLKYLHNDHGCLCRTLNFPQCVTSCEVNLLVCGIFSVSTAEWYRLYSHGSFCVVLHLTLVFQLHLCENRNCIWNLKHLKRMLVKSVGMIFHFKFMQVYIGWGTSISRLLNYVRGTGVLEES